MFRLDVIYLLSDAFTGGFMAISMFAGGKNRAMSTAKAKMDSRKRAVVRFLRDWTIL